MPDTYREVKTLLPAEQVDMDGFLVWQPFPTEKVENIDPFLLLHHAEMQIDAETEPRHGGIGPHPHRGFSPVTFIFKGGIHHRDSRGNNSTVYAGGVQWMNAGMGLIHSERPPHNIQALGAKSEIIQLWINTPARHKMDVPQYYALNAEQIPVATSADGKVEVRVIAGELMATRGPIQHISAVNAATIYMQSAGQLQMQVPVTHHVFLYLLHGKISIAGYGLVEARQAVVFESNSEVIAFETLQEGSALLMSGEPLHEPVVAQGPFVMNTQTQILEAMRDYQMGKMGFLVEE